MCAAWAVTALARCPEIDPLRRIGAGVRPVVVLLLADVTTETVLVPLLDDAMVVFVGADDLEIVEPLAARDIPAGREQHHPAAIDRRDVVLNPPAAERELDAVLMLAASDVRLGDEVTAVGGAQPVGLPAKRNGTREIALDTLQRCRLQHLAVTAALPRVVHGGVAGCAHLGADERALTRRPGSSRR